MDDELSLLTNYIFSSADTEQLWDQQHLTVKEKKDGGSTVPLTYAASIVIGINLYGRKIYTIKLWKQLEQVNQLSRQVSMLGIAKDVPGKRAKEREGHAKQTWLRTPQGGNK